MDPALPPGGLDRIFRQYDAIRTHSTRDDGPAPWEPEEDQAQPATAKQPSPSQSPPTSAKPPPPPTPPPTQVNGFITRNDDSDGKVTVDGPGPPQQVLTDSTRRRPVGKPKSWQPNNVDRIRGELGQRRFFHDLANPTRSSFAADEAGLSKAYADTTSEGVYYDPSNRTMYVKGTVPTSASDWWDDLSKIPVWGDIHDVARTKQAEAAYQNLIRQGKPVD